MVEGIVGFVQTHNAHLVVHIPTTADADPPGDLEGRPGVGHVLEVGPLGPVFLPGGLGDARRFLEAQVPQAELLGVALGHGQELVLEVPVEAEQHNGVPVGGGVVELVPDAVVFLVVGGVADAQIAAAAASAGMLFCNLVCGFLEAVGMLGRGKLPDVEVLDALSGQQHIRCRLMIRIIVSIRIIIIRSALYLHGRTGPKALELGVGGTIDLDVVQYVPPLDHIVVLPLLVDVDGPLQVPNEHGVELRRPPGDPHEDVFGVVADIDGGDQVGVDAPGVDLTGDGPIALGELGVDQDVGLLARGDDVVVLDPEGPREVPDPESSVAEAAPQEVSRGGDLEGCACIFWFCVEVVVCFVLCSVELWSWNQLLSVVCVRVCACVFHV